MPYQAQQIVTLSCQTAKVPAWTVQGGQLLNMILSELCQDYDLAVARNTFHFNFNTGLTQGSGPYPMPADFLRPDKNNVFYTILGVKYIMIPITLAEYNAKVQQAGLNAYPEDYAIDNSGLSGPAVGLAAVPLMYVWVPPAGNYPVTVVYYSQMSDIPTPETSTTIPWFPNQLYLIRRLTGELMLISGDDRAARFLGGITNDGGGEFMGAAAILDHYLKLKDDSAQVPQRVTLDRRRFGLAFDKARSTKIVGW